MDQQHNQNEKKSASFTVYMHRGSFRSSIIWLAASSYRDLQGSHYHREAENKTKTKTESKQTARAEIYSKRAPFFLSNGERRSGGTCGRVDPLIHPYPLNDQGQGMTVAESRRSRRLQSRPSAGGGARWQATARKIRCRPSTRRTIRRAGASSSVKGSTQMPRSRISILESSIDGWEGQPAHGTASRLPAGRWSGRSLLHHGNELARARAPPSPMRKQGGC